MYGHREYRLFNLDRTNTLPFVSSSPCQCGSAYRFSRLTYLTGRAPILTRPPRATWESTHFIFSSKSSKFSGTSSLGFSGYHLAQRLFYHVLSITHLSEKSNPRARWKVSFCQCTWNRKWNYVNLCSKWIDVDGTGSFCNSTFWSVEAIWCWTTTSCRRDQRSKFQVSHASC